MWIACGVGLTPYASAVTVEDLRLWRAPDHTRVVLDLSEQVEHRISVLGNPDRVVIDLHSAAASTALNSRTVDDPLLIRVRVGTPKPNVLRFVLDLKQKARPRSFALTPNEIYGHRLVVDLYDSAQQSQPVAPPPSTARRSYFVVAIDAGHGGEDPGAIGRRRTKEKNITLNVALELKRLIDADPQLRAVMVRRGDYYISLRERTAIARRNQADVFISIHADAFPKSASVSGSSVYALSQRGASSESARWLADKENAADLIGGVSLRDKDDLLAQVLWDLSMTKTVSESLSLGGSVLSELGRLGKLHRKRVEQAGFAVLKSPDMPSILVETAFLSNPNEEKLLNSTAHQHRVARAIYQGVRRYLGQRPLHLDGPTVHVVVAGDSLSKIALRYRVSVASIKKANNMTGDTVRIGQKLKIPSG